MNANGRAALKVGRSTSSRLVKGRSLYGRRSRLYYLYQESQSLEAGLFAFVAVKVTDVG